MRSYLTYENRQGKEYGASLRDGSAVHARGWDAGVKVVVQAEPGKPDVFEIYMTGGSHAKHTNVRIGSVTNTPNGPVFEPAPSVLDQEGATL